MDRNIVFVRTRHDYDSYLDFWRLVELSGFPIRYVDEVDVGERAAFVLSPINCEWEAHMETQRARDRRAHLVLWDLERPVPRGGLGQMKEHAQRHLDRRLFDEIWVSDRALASECGFRFVVMGSDERLAGKKVSAPKRWDVCHFMYLNDRRKKLLDGLDGVRVAPNCWPPRRGRVIRRSKFGLTVHQDGQPYQEPLRLALFAAHGLPVVSEAVFDPYPWSNEFAVFASYPDLPERIAALLENDYEIAVHWGKLARTMLCGFFRFRQQVLEAVEGSVGPRPYPVGVRKRSLGEKLKRRLKYILGIERRAIRSG